MHHHSCPTVRDSIAVYQCQGLSKPVHEHWPYWVIIGNHIKCLASKFTVCLSHEGYGYQSNIYVSLTRSMVNNEKSMSLSRGLWLEKWHHQITHDHSPLSCMIKFFFSNEKKKLSIDEKEISSHTKKNFIKWQKNFHQTSKNFHHIIKSFHKMRKFSSDDKKFSPNDNQFL